MQEGEDLTKQAEGVTDVVAELGLGAPEPRSIPISKNRLEQLMRSGNIEVLGVVYDFISDPKHRPLIEPRLEFRDYHRFITAYFGRCFREDPKSRWACSRYSAGWDLVNWFVSFWNDETVPRSAISELKEWLATLYREGDANLRTCLETATLEHLFEHKTIQKFFTDWERDPVLGTAYSAAAAWVKGGGKTPLGKPARVRKAKAATRKR